MAFLLHVLDGRRRQIAVASVMDLADVENLEKVLEAAGYIVTVDVSAPAKRVSKTKKGDASN